MHKAVLSILTICCSILAAITPARGQTDETEFFRYTGEPCSGPLVSSATAMETAWDLVRNPLTDSIAGDSEHVARVRRGFRIFIQTPAYAPGLSGNGLTCGNCHLNAGQRERALPLVGIASVFPQYNKRAGRTITLAERIIGCFMRSMNAVGTPGMIAAHDPAEVSGAIGSSAGVRDLEAYLRWLSEGFRDGDTIPWRGKNAIDRENLVPPGELDSARGGKLYMEHCANCHGEDGGGVAIGDIRAGPLWGPASWNDGAGAARIYTLAGMIRYMMPYVSPGALDDRDVQDISFFINSHDRPEYPFKSADYRTEKMPADALYYTRKK